MTNRINLLPQSYFARRKERRSLGSVVAGGAVVLGLLVLWWVSLGGQINGAKNELGEVQAHNANLRTQIAQLQRFAELREEVATKEAALVTVMQGDVSWPSVMNEVAMVVPGEVWLTGFTGSVGFSEGAVPVGTETAEVRISDAEALGRVQFQGTSLKMPGVSKWLIRLDGVPGFRAVWLNGAQEVDIEERKAFTFDSTLELGRRALSMRYMEGS